MRLTRSFFRFSWPFLSPCKNAILAWSSARSNSQLALSISNRAHSCWIKWSIPGIEYLGLLSSLFPPGPFPVPPAEPVVPPSSFPGYLIPSVMKNSHSYATFTRENPISLPRKNQSKQPSPQPRKITYKQKILTHE